MRQELTGQLTMALIEQRYRAEQEQSHAPCPQCGRQVAARGVVTRKVETLVGEVELARPYFYCVPGGQGFAPLDTALGVAPGRKQFDVQQAVVKLVAEVPYETAQAWFAELRGVGVSTARLHELTNGVAEGLNVLDVAPPRAEILAKIAAVAAGRRWRPIGVLAIDGADLPTRPEAARGRRPGRKKHRAKRARWQGEGREAKGFRFYLVDDDRIVHLLSWQQIQDHEELFAEVCTRLQAQPLPTWPGLEEWAPVRAHFAQIALLDGSTLEALRKKTQALQQVDGLALAGRMMVMVEAFSQRPLWHLYTEDAAANDKRFAPQILAAVPAGSLVVFDLGFFSFLWFDDCTDQQFGSSAFRVGTNPASVRERGAGQGNAEFFVGRKRGMSAQCIHHDGWQIHTGSLAFGHGLPSTASSVTPRPASFAFCGRGKNKLWGLWARAEGLLRPQGAQGARSVVWRYPGLPGSRGAACVVSQLRRGETGETARGSRQSLLHQALCLLRRPPVPHRDAPSRRTGVAPGLADGQGVGQTLHAGATAPARDTGAQAAGRGRDCHSQGTHLPHWGQRSGTPTGHLVRGDGAR